MSDISNLLELMKTLRDPENGCPWDAKQTFSSIAPYTVEEAYEVADAIAHDDMGELKSELGDLLFQVVFHARMAEELEQFDFQDVVAAIVAKLTRRHPHIFGSSEERQATPAPGSWERIKAEERREHGRHGALDGIPIALPALSRAEKLGKRASRVGFDWPDAHGPRAKVAEELREFDDAFASGNAAASEEELGDLLFAVVNVARHSGIDPEAALTAANRKFEQRFPCRGSRCRGGRPQPERARCSSTRPALVPGEKRMRRQPLASRRSSKIQQFRAFRQGSWAQR